MSNAKTPSIKGLASHLHTDETLLATVPAIWDGGSSRRSTPCDVIVTNQRLIGYYSVSIPRERLFLEDLPLSTITAVSLRQKSFAPIFRELQVNSSEGTVYIRAPRQKIETLYNELRSAIERYAPSTRLDDATTETSTQVSTSYGRQEIKAPFESSPLAITLLFVGGIALEIFGTLVWASQGSAAGLPLCIAGFVAVIMSFVVRRQRT